MGVGAASSRSAFETGLQSRVARFLLTASAYGMTGWLAHLLALPPAYATPIWPPAGIALVAVMLWGRPAAAGVILGAFLANIGFGLESPDKGTASVLAMSLLLSLGAAAQALFGAWLARLVLGPGNPLERGQSVLLLLVLGGPLACLLNAAWGPLWLTALGFIPPADLVTNGFTWWVGDVIGVLLVAPLLLAWHTPPFERRVGRWMTLAVPLVVCIAGVVALFFETERAAEQRQRFAFETHGRAVALAITAGVDRASAYSESMARAFGALPSIDRAAFRTLVSPWLAANPSADAVLWMPCVRARDLPAFEIAQRDRAFPDYHVRADPLDGEALVPSDHHAPILFVEPLDRERGVVGYDAASNPILRRTLERARDSGEVVATPSAHVEGGPDPNEIFTVAAAYGGMYAPETLAARRAELRGFVAASVHVDRLVDVALARTDGTPLAVRVTDLSVYPGQPLYGPAVPTDRSVFTTYESVAGRTWRLDIFPRQPPAPSWTGWTVLAAGLASTGLVVAFILDAGARALRVEQLVAERTRTLGRVNEALTRSNLELQRFAYVASHDMREPLRTIACFTELLARDEEPRLDPAGRSHLRRILGATRRMQGLVNEVLAFARVGARTEPFTVVRLEEPVRVALDGMAVDLQQAGAHVTVAALPEATCDRMQMVQLFSNLLSNAIKFRRPGVSPIIEITGKRTPQGCEIAVRDNGIGIERQHWDRVFEIFHKLHPESEFPGQGIGLSTCRRIVERHGGRIWVESAPGRGSVIRFTLKEEAAR